MWKKIETEFWLLKMEKWTLLKIRSRSQSWDFLILIM